MDKPKRYPKLVTDYGPVGSQSHKHLTVLVTWRPGEEPVRVCGESWCDGRCGYPAMVIPADTERSEHKMYSSMVAFGPVMQRWRLEWKARRSRRPKSSAPTSSSACGCSWRADCRCTGHD